MAGPASNYSDEIIEAIREAIMGRSDMQQPTIPMEKALDAAVPQYRLTPGLGDTRNATRVPE